MVALALYMLFAAIDDVLRNEKIPVYTTYNTSFQYLYNKFLNKLNFVFMIQFHLLLTLSHQNDVYVFSMNFTDE